MAVFLLREWISQNARPGVFEEEEIAGIPPQGPPVLNPPPVNQPVQDANARLLVPQRQDPLDLELEARRRPGPWRPHRPVPANARFEALQRHLDMGERPELFRDPIRRPQNPRVDPILVPAMPVAQPPENLDTSVDTGKGKEKEDVAADAVPSASEVREHLRRRYGDSDSNENTESVAKPGPSAFPASNSASSSSLLEPVSGRSSPVESTPFEFTFRVPANESSEEDIREPVPEMPALSLIALQTAMMTGTPIPDEEPRRRSIVFAPDLSPRTPTPRSTTPAVEDETDLKPSSDPSSSTSSDLSFVHLPTSSSALAAEDGLGSSSLRDATSSEPFTLQGTFDYPPEALGMDSSNSPAGNTDRKKRSRDDMEEEFEHYFRDPQPATLNPLDTDINVPDEVAHRPERDHVADGGDRPPVEAGPDDEDDSEDDEASEPEFWDADADREDEDDEDEDPVDIGDFNVPNRPVPQPQPPAQAPVEQQLNEGVDDLEAAVEDDMEGALEGRLTLQN